MRTEARPARDPMTISSDRIGIDLDRAGCDGRPACGRRISSSPRRREPRSNHAPPSLASRRNPGPPVDVEGGKIHRVSILTTSATARSLSASPQRRSAARSASPRSYHVRKADEEWNRAWKIRLIERENPERRDLAEVLVQRLVPAGAGTTLCFALTKKAGLMPGHRHPTAIGWRGADTRERATSSPPWRSRRPWRRRAP